MSVAIVRFMSALAILSVVLPITGVNVAIDVFGNALT